MKNLVLVSIALSVAAAPLAAQTVVKPSSLQGWLLFDGNGNGDPSTITTAQPFNGKGSLQLSITGGAQQPAAAIAFGPISLSALRQTSINDFGFRFNYLAPPGAVAAPTFRVYLNGIANAHGTTTGSFGYIGSTGPGWQTVNVNFDDGDFFFRVEGQGQVNSNCENTGLTSDFATTRLMTDWTIQCNDDPSRVDLRNASIYAVGFDYGSFPGFSGSTTTWVDELSWKRPGTNGDVLTAEFNFEPDPVPSTSTPEPSSLALVAASLLGLGAFARRWRRR